VLTVIGATAVTFMMLMYALERRHADFELAVACGCALSSTYGFLAGAWPFGVVEAIWALVAARRFFSRDPKSSAVALTSREALLCLSCAAPRWMGEQASVDGSSRASGKRAPLDPLCVRGDNVSCRRPGLRIDDALCGYQRHR
jgi:hypothetical protein